MILPWFDVSTFEFITLWSGSSASNPGPKFLPASFMSNFLFPKIIICIHTEQVYPIVSPPQIFGEGDLLPFVPSLSYLLHCSDAQNAVGPMYMSCDVVTLEERLTHRALRDFFSYVS